MEQEIFDNIKDPRVLGKVKHPLEDVLRMALIGVLCACEDFDEIRDFVEERRRDLVAAGFLALPNGVPSADTVRRVVEAVNPKQFREALDRCRDSIVDNLCGHHVIIDGKKLRGEDPKSRGCDGLYILNAWVSEAEVSVAEHKVGDKTNELAVLPSILASMWLTGSVVSVDAMGTHRSIANQIIMQGGDYLMALKDNQPILNRLVDSVFDSSKTISSYASASRGHGREEKREHSVIGTRLLEQEGMYEAWPGLKRIVRVTRRRTENGIASKETVYYLSSEEKDDAKYFAKRIRSHWGIENKLHWQLDVTFNEDGCRVRTGNGAVNLSSLRKYAMECLKSRNDKLSLKRRRKKCMLNFEYLAQVLNKC